MKDVESNVIIALLTANSKSPFKLVGYYGEAWRTFGGNPYMTPEEILDHERDQSINVAASYVEIRVDTQQEVLITERSPDGRTTEVLYQGYPMNLATLAIVLGTLQPFNPAHQ